MARETETKYEADAGSVIPGLDTLPAVRGTRGPAMDQLDADYYDTADLRLLRLGITLRRRTGGHDAGWHLKLPAGQASRDEIRLPLAEGDRNVPAELATLVSAASRGARLAPVAAIATARRTTTLLGANGESLAEVADDQVQATASGKAEAVRWREIEIELTGGNASLLATADKLLERAGLHRSGRSAKLERVLEGRPPDRPGAAATGHEPTAAEVVTAYLRAQTDKLIVLDPQVRRGSPDAVHQMRVATRRLRSTLRSFGTVVAGSSQVAGELKWLGSVLGELRDAEVQAARLHDQVRQTDIEVLLGPVQARIQAYAAREAASGRAAVTAALDSARYYAMLDSLDALIGHPKAGRDAGRPARKVLPHAVKRCYRKTRRRMRAALRQPHGPARDSALHAARKAAKRARYAADAAAPVSGQQARRFAAQMKKVQTVLGDHQDTVVGRQVTRRLGVAAQLAGEPAFSYGLFYGRDGCLGDHLDARAGKVWQRASRHKYRRWLG